MKPVIVPMLLALAACGPSDPARLLAVFTPDRVVVATGNLQNMGGETAVLGAPAGFAESLRLERTDGASAPTPPPSAGTGALISSDKLPERIPSGDRFTAMLDLAARFPELSHAGTWRLTWRHPGVPGEASMTLQVIERYAVIETTFGNITLEFHPEDAPGTVDNFAKLARKGFYNGLTFHRIIPGFMMQGGCPKGDGTGGPGYEIPAEFNSRKHLPGTVAMARSNDPDSAGSQFYICFAPRPDLDRKYTTFAEVVKGMDVVKQVEPVGTQGGTPTQKVVMNRVTLTDSLNR